MKFDPSELKILELVKRKADVRQSNVKLENTKRYRIDVKVIK
jgi:hypothetical protein